MISSVRNVVFGNLPKQRQIKRDKVVKNTSIPYQINSIYSNAGNINFAGYFNISKSIPFEETLKLNYFELPKVSTKDGNEIQIQPDESQIECARNLYDGKNVVFDAPTGMGKTAIAHYAINKNLENNKKTIYTVPIKALANDKYNEFSKIYGQDSVGLLTGDRKINPNAPIVIMVTEIFRNQTNSLTEKEANKIGTVIYDEVHYISDDDRGGAWEYSILNSNPLGVQSLALSATVGNADELTDWISSVSKRPTVRVSVDSNDRPVPLVWKLYKNNDFVPIVDGEIDLNQELTDRKKQALDILFKAEYLKEDDYKLTNDDYDFMYAQLKSGIGEGQNNFKHGIKSFQTRLKKEFKTLDDSQVELITQLMLNPEDNKVRTIHTPWAYDNLPVLVDDLKRENMLPAIIFKLSQNGCENAINRLSNEDIELDENSLEDTQIIESKNKKDMIDLLSEEEKQQMEEIIDKYESRGVYLGGKINKEMLLKGWAVHHAGRMPQYKKLVEELFSKKLIKVVVATSTLGAGINMPAKTVVLTNIAYKKYNPETKELENVPLTANEFHQMAGRAGRRGIDKIGSVVLYNLHTPSNSFRRKEDKTDKIDELQLAYELINTDADDLRSAFRPEATMLAQYYSENPDLSNIKEIINNSFKTYLAKDSEKEQKSLMKKFENYSQVLLKQGYLMKDYKKQMTLTPKGMILAQSQGMNPLMLSSLMYDEKLAKVSREQLCQIAAHIVGSDEQGDSEEFSSLISEKIKYYAKQKEEIGINPTDFEHARAIFKNKEDKVLKSLKEAKANQSDIKMTDSFSGMVGFLFASLNKTYPENSVSNFELITQDSLSVVNSSDEKINNDYKRKDTEGQVYKIIAGSITTLKQMINICDYALSDEENFPNVQYWEKLKNTAKEAITLLDKEPINNNPNYENKFSNI